jgi:N-acetylglucosamine repressor
MKINSRKSDRNLMKQMNQSPVLQLIQGRGPISRRDISRLSGLSAASVSGITNTLIELGLVYEVGEAEENGRAGRKAVLLRLRPNAGLVVGVKLGVYFISCVDTDLDANVLYSTEHLFSSSDPTGAPYNPETTIQATIQVISDLLKNANIDVSRLLGIGVGINGPVDADSGISCLAPHFGWHNVSIAEPLRAHFGIPVYLENDARTLTIAEQWFGSGREVNHFVTVVIGYGTGSGLVTNKQLNRGASGGAGEFGHTVFQKDGPLCSCGKRGCLESLTSISAVTRMIEEALASGESGLLAGQEPLTVEAIAQAAQAGDRLTLRVLDTAGRYLGLGLASLVNVLNPELIVINGEAVAFGPAYLAPMEAELHRNVFDGLADSLQIIVESAGNEVWARGAACVVLSSLFTSSEYQKIMPLI